MTNAQIVKGLVGLEPDLDILEIEEVKKKGKIVKIIHVSNGEIRVRCPKCNKYTRNIHDKLKSIEIKYLKIAGYVNVNIKLKIYRRNFRWEKTSQINNRKLLKISIFLLLQYS